MASALRWPLHIPLTCLRALRWVLLRQALLFCYTRFTPCSSAGFSFPQTPLRYSLVLIFYLVGETHVLGVWLACWLTRHRLFCPRKRFSLAKLGKSTRILIFYTPRQKSLRRPGRRFCHTITHFFCFVPIRGSFLDGLDRARGRLALK